MITRLADQKWLGMADGWPPTAPVAGAVEVAGPDVSAVTVYALRADGGVVG